MCSRQYPPEQAGEEIRTGFPIESESSTNNLPAPVPDPARVVENAAFTLVSDSDEEANEADSRKPSPLDEVEVENAWKSANEERENGGVGFRGYYDAFGDRDRDVWGRDD